MTLHEKEHSIEKMGGKWVDLMQRGRQMRELRLATVVATKGVQSLEDAAVCAELDRHRKEYEDLLDRIITMAQRAQELTNRQIERN